MPRLQALYNDYGSQDFMPISINLWQDMSIVTSYARQYDYLFLRDAGTVWNQYRIGGYIPLNYVVDRYGIVVGGAEGFSESTLRSWIESVLPQTGVEEGGVPVLARSVSASPNPAASPTQIRFTMPQAGTAVVRVYSSAGALVRTLTTAEGAAGPASVRWDLADEGGNPVTTGLYFAEVSVGGETETAKLTVTR